MKRIAHSPFGFMIYDATLFTGRPDLYPLGINPAGMIYQGALFPSGEFSQPADPAIAKSLGAQVSAASPLVIIDVEHWPISGDALVVADSVPKYVETLHRIKPAFQGLDRLLRTADRSGLLGCPLHTEFACIQTMASV